MDLSLDDVLKATNPDIISADNATPQIEIDYLNLLLAFLQTPQFGAFPVTNWADGSPFKALLQADSHALASLASTMYNVIEGGILDLATGDWLNFWGESQYQEGRYPSTQQVGWVWITVQGPVNLAAGELVIGASSTQQYGPVIQTTGTNGEIIFTPAPVNISDGGSGYPYTAQLLFQALATTPGSLGVVPAGAINQVVSPNVPGMTVTNLNPDNTGVWEVVHGIDEELDDAYRLRLKSKWPSLALLRGSTVDAWGFWITESSTKVRRWNVLENSPQGGEVTIYVDPITETASVNLFINGDGTTTNPAHRPLCTRVWVYNSATSSIYVEGRVYVKQAFLAAAQLAFDTAIAQLSGMLSMGSTVYYSVIMGFIQNSTHVDHSENVTLNGTAVDVSLASYAVPNLIDALTWIGI
jgi:hypothetical protein